MTETAPESSPTPPRSTRERIGRAWTLTAAAIVALIVLAALVVIFATRGGDKTPATAARKPPRSTPSAARGSAAPTLPAQDQTVPVSPPAGVAWALFQGVALPSSATAGPSRVDGPVHAGYAHTPTGALIAAMQVSARYLITSGNNWRAIVEAQVVPDAGRDVYVSKRAKLTTTAVPPGTYGQVAGFRFVTYTPDVAVIQYVSRFASGNLQVVTDTVKWLAGDWKLQLQPDGSETPTAQAVTSLNGFVPWSGL